MGETATRGGVGAPWWAIAAGLAIAALSAFGAPRSAAAEALVPEPTIRVLLAERPRVTLRRGARGGADTVVESRGGLLWANHKPVGQTWTLRGGRDEILRADGVRVRGSLVAHRAGARVQLVNELGLEAYVAGTLGREVYPDWERETLKAQAVVARTYALYRRERAREAGAADFDLDAGTGSQVYGGVDAETPALVSAVAETRGEILSYGSEPILAVYHSASGGRTAAAEEVWGEPVPYLISVPVEDLEDSPDTYWRATLSRPKLVRALAPLGIGMRSLENAEVTERSPSGRALRVRLLGVDSAGNEKSHTMEARALRSALGASVIRSTLFEIRKSGDDFVFVGSGHGHGVGMSQWGAEAMARSGAGYREILSVFYPGARLERARGARP